jgi:hypothetical protein
VHPPRRQSSGRRPCSRSNMSAPPRRREQQQIGAVAGSGVADGKCCDLGFAEHRRGLEVEVANLFPGRQPDFGEMAATARFSIQEGEIPRETDSPLEEDGFELPVRGRGKSGYRPFCAAQAPERLALRPGSRRCLRPAPAIVFTRGQTMRCTAPKQRIVPAMILPRTDEPMQR